MASRTSGTPTSTSPPTRSPGSSGSTASTCDFLTGTDEHGLKMVETAAAEGIPTAELARRNSDVFQRLQKKLNISFDRFIRTTDADHHEASKEIWRRMAGGRRHLPRHLLRLVLGARRTVLRRIGDHARGRQPGSPSRPAPR